MLKTYIQSLVSSVIQNCMFVSHKKTFNELVNYITLLTVLQITSNASTVFNDYALLYPENHG